MIMCWFCFNSVAALILKRCFSTEIVAAEFQISECTELQMRNGNCKQDVARVEITEGQKDLFVAKQLVEVLKILTLTIVNLSSANFIPKTSGLECFGYVLHCFAVVVCLFVCFFVFQQHDLEYIWLQEIWMSKRPTY